MAELLHDLFVMPDFDNARIIVTFTPPEGCTAATWEVIDEGKAIVQGTLDTWAGEGARFEAAIPSFKPWNVHTPHLYTLKLTLAVKDRTVEVIRDFGMRKIHATRDALYVNNEKFYVKGFIRVREAHDHPNLENLPLEDYYAKNIRAAKAYGFNFIRFHSRIPPEECFRAADRLGIFIHIEMRKYYGKYQKERALMEMGELLNEDEWREMILKLRNHPSLMVYCMGNEIDHPGRNPKVERAYRIAKALDPTRLFLDTCSRGEFDRKHVDFDVQHMSYFFPFGKNYGMFEDTQNWLIYGSCTGLPVADQDAGSADAWAVTRKIPSPRPVLAHEVCHYIALRDVDALDEKFTRVGAEKPWWIDELKKLIKLKKLEKDYPQLLEASRRFQFLCWKLGLEGARRSRLLSGFHFLQLSDTERYENSNGIVDCFDDPKGVPEAEFLKFNSDTVLLADLPRRTYFEGEAVTLPVMVSHFAHDVAGMADYAFSLESKNGSALSIRGGLKKIPLDERGLREICRLKLNLPTVQRAEAPALSMKLTAEDGSYTIENDWNLWVYPNRPRELPAVRCTVALDEVNLRARYPQIESVGDLDNPEKLLIVNRFSAHVIRHLKRGGDVLLLYRVPETRDRRTRAEKEEYYLPAAWDRFKGVVWDRGNNCGAFMREHPVWNGFPHSGFMDLQFHALVNDCDKICLDDFPCDVTPIMQGVDKAVRDRFDVFNFKLSEFQPAYTLRKFAYLFELTVGKGRLFVTGFNFTGLSANTPETCAMFESVFRYVTSEAFQPKAAISPQQLEAYLLEKGKTPRIKPRRMTQFWQLDEEPLESKRFWKEALEYLEETPLVSDRAWQEVKKA